jgi:mannose-6-phosphate isomerase-like protein (cupin superfamily)
MEESDLGRNFRETGLIWNSPPTGFAIRTDTFCVLDGEATIVTGGTMVGGKGSRPNQQLGTSINGGETRHLAKGDVIVIPAGVPH